MTAPLLEARSLSKDFSIVTGAFRRQHLRAVKDVDLTVMQGDVMAIVGESGSGKTTLAKMLLGVLAPSAGSVLVDGKPLRVRARKELARLIQPIFQDPYASLNPRKTIGSIIRLPLDVQGTLTRTDRERRVSEIMDLVGLTRRLYDSHPNQLSGGQRQRVAIARALVNQPRIIICDEPTSALDMSVQAQILNLLQELRAELGLTYLLISHDFSVVEYMASRIAVMYLGQIVEEAASASIFERPRHPYTQALLQSVLTPDATLGLPETHLGSSYPDPLNPPKGCPFHPRCPRKLDLCQSHPPPMATNGGRLSCHLNEQSTP